MKRKHTKIVIMSVLGMSLIFAGLGFYFMPSIVDAAAKMGWIGIENKVSKDVVEENVDKEVEEEEELHSNNSFMPEDDTSYDESLELKEYVSNEQNNDQQEDITSSTDVQNMEENTESVENQEENPKVEEKIYLETTNGDNYTSKEQDYEIVNVPNTATHNRYYISAIGLTILAAGISIANRDSRKSQA